MELIIKTLSKDFLEGSRNEIRHIITLLSLKDVFFYMYSGDFQKRKWHKWVDSAAN